ncbi:MAG: helix-turn-helix domain-containing protein [Armatimonadota bacterium]|nr:helix-turn-helix domain-containing protein [Armatimonadota bacterium]
MRNVQDWNKYVDMLGKAVTKKTAVPVPASHENSVKPCEEARNGSGRTTPVPPRKGRGPHREETKEELLRRLLDPTLTLEETARLLDVCPTTVRRYTNRGILPHERSAGNQRRFKLSSVLAFREDQQRIKSADDPAEEE